ncbi:hypothetical protein MtrunA17_Chr2g0312331 [Medicago truncatula]|uniref:Transmembrane protein n=1 Tax=Medicago truncatula TaxID=3880 RepID=I3SQ82_MEDTR|nr:unknown [Medicago truncatula]RHN74618.1 hypothetical protein MtrunA17_Chr2g0312331 [Medicago truncatula]
MDFLFSFVPLFLIVFAFSSKLDPLQLQHHITTIDDSDSFSVRT